MQIATVSTILVTALTLCSPCPGAPEGMPVNPRSREPRQQTPAITMPPVNQPHAPSGFDTDCRSGLHGKVSHIQYHATTDGKLYRATIYLPPGYTTTRTYPVLYLLHGASGNEKTWVEDIHASAILNNLYSAKKIVPMIVVMPSCYPIAGNDQQPSRQRGGAGSCFIPVFLNDLMPYITSHYRVATDGARRALAGLSMGGAITLQIMGNNPKLFGFIGAFSGGGSRSLRQVNLTSIRPLLLWLSVGRSDNLTGRSMYEADQLFTSKKVTHVFRINDGGHEPKVWRNDLYYFLQKLFKKTTH